MFPLKFKKTDKLDIDANLITKSFFHSFCKRSKRYKV